MKLCGFFVTADLVLISTVCLKVHTVEISFLDFGEHWHAIRFRLHI